MTKEQALLSIDASGIKPGQVWRHYKGGTYRIIATAIDESTLTPMVIYQSTVTNLEMPWARTLANFLSTVDVKAVERRFYPVF